MTETRNRGTRKDGSSFSKADVDEVWSKAKSIDGEDMNSVRTDVCGARIEYTRYGDTGHDSGWEIDHIVPVSKGGADAIDNLQPLQWENNRAKSDGDLNCVKT